VPHDFLVARYNDLEGTPALLDRHSDDLAAILVEPMQGAAGCIPGEPAFLEYLRRAASESGAVLIFDEIQTARLSFGGRQELLGIAPDLTTIGKFFGGGLAFGCFGGRRDLMELLDPRRPAALAHPGTFNNNTLTMAAGSAAVSGLLSAEALQRLNSRGERLRETLLSVFSRNAAPFTVTGLGSLMNIHPWAPPPVAGDLRKLLFLELAGAGIYVAARGLIALSFALTEDDIARLVGALEEFLHRNRALFPS
jgi:glutamate-1-semialdehyde 2,1-aminomutase